jgi:hypothetical protein
VWPTVSLEEVRRKAEHHRKAANEGRDARSEEKRDGGALFVSDAFESFFEVRRQQLSNGKHVQQWQNTMRDYAFPVFGDHPLAEITAGEVIEVLKPIWFTKPETAARVLGFPGP